MADLNERLTLPCGASIKNRIAKAAMTEGVADASNQATDRHIRLYERWAQGGAGLLITGNVMVDRRFLERPGNVAIDGQQSPKAAAGLESYAHAATEHGSDIWVQLSHAGRQSPKYVVSEPVGPSAVGVDLPGGQFGTPRALTHEEIEDVIARFAFAAATVKTAGFTGVQIHAAHGYLISEFLSPLVNQRTDQWGGSLENRARLLLKTIRAVRLKVGSGFPIAVKLNSSDFQKGGFSFDECLTVVGWLNEAGIDLLEISGGSYEQPQMMGMDGMDVPHEDRRAESTKAREAYFVEYAAEVAKIAKMPLMVTGGFRSREAMDAALLSGAADVIGIGRPLCVDTDAPAQLLSGSTQALRSYEDELRIGPGILGPQSSVQFLRAINGFATMAFFYQNIFRLADGLEPKTKMALLPAFLKHQSHEQSAGKRLDR